MNKKGFTLIELIIVITVIFVLAATIFVAIDPNRRLHETRNARRWSDVTAILNAIEEYQSDNEGIHYSKIDDLDNGSFYRIGTETAAVCDNDCVGETPEPECVDLSGMGTNYMPIVPIDPNIGTQADTAYMLMKEDVGLISIYACNPEGEGAGGTGTPPEIKATR